MKQFIVYNKLASTQITKQLADKMVNYLLGYDKSTVDLSTRSSNLLDKLYGCIDNELVDKGLNLFGLHSGITNYTTHVKSSPKRENGLTESLMVGSSYKMNMKSFEFVNQQLELV